MSLKLAGAPPAAKVKPFGPNDELLYTLSDVRGGVSRVGAVLWGLGVAEVKTARTLAKKGIVSLQLRINGPDFYDDARRNEIYRLNGIDYNRLAMDKLAAERGVTSFILMGNCACANLCFHAAVRDPRVVGVILTNPYVSKSQLRTFRWRKLLGPSAWKGLAANGAARASAQLATLMQGIVGRLTPQPSREKDASRAQTRQSIELPQDVVGALRHLCDRGVRILIACTTSDDSFLFLGRRHKAAIDVLESEGSLHFAGVDSGAHVFSTDDAAANVLNNVVFAWMDATTFMANDADECIGQRDFPPDPVVYRPRLEA
jgi:hypothetical protein